MSHALVVEGLKVRLDGGDGAAIVHGVDLRLDRGEILGLVGESGSGKTTLARALLGYASPGASIEVGRLEIDGREAGLGGDVRTVRGSSISYVPQDPGRALNPALRVADALNDVLTAHRRDGEGATAALPDYFARVGLPGTIEFGRKLPHQMSGGQQQRVCIAIALSCSPPVVVLDEPTTGLDVVTQAHILRELRRLRSELGIAMIYVSHDLAAVAEISDRVAVMYGGEIVEEGSADEVLTRPRHPYTRGLLASTPDHRQPRALEPMHGLAAGAGVHPGRCSFEPRCQLADDACRSGVVPLTTVADRWDVRCVRPDAAAGPPAAAAAVDGTERTATDSGAPLLQVRDLTISYPGHPDPLVVADDISFTVSPGRCVALVGESGSGKTSIARAVAGLQPFGPGRIELRGEAVAPRARDRSVTQRRDVQLVFQNPGDALNPRRTVRDQIARPARTLRHLRGSELQREVTSLLDAVRLSPRLADRFPAELSGGERQRVAIARALAAGPRVLVCDEITSALDVSVQAAVLALLQELRDGTGLGLLFITHNLGVVASIADEVLVLNRGRICEHGPVDAVLNAATDPYTKTLLEAAPSITTSLRSLSARASTLDLSTNG